MIEKSAPLYCRWELLPDGYARLLRVEGEQDSVRIPEVLEGYPVTQIGAYCFAPEYKYADEALSNIRETWIIEDETQKQSLRAVTGNYLSEVCLPDSVTRIGNNAFYNCRKLWRIEVGVDLQDIGSDVFMNCHQIRQIDMRGGMEESSGLKQILSRLSGTVCVRYMGHTPSRLLYPEYVESYDEIAPAHIFGRNIEGEGFRLRQLFADGRVQLAEYDSAFGKIAAEESVQVAGLLALYRLMSPVQLTEDNRRNYETYVRNSGQKLMQLLIQDRELDSLEYLCRQKLLSSLQVDQAIQEAGNQEWSEGSASLMQWKHQYCSKQDRYSF